MVLSANIMFIQLFVYKFDESTRYPCSGQIHPTFSRIFTSIKKEALFHWIRKGLQKTKRVVGFI
jgi:hypothetical protein